MIALGYGMALLQANDEETMVNGLTFLVDFEGFTIRHQTFYGLDTMKKTTKMWTVIIIDQLGSLERYSSPSILQPFILRPPLFIRPPNWS